MRRIAILIVLGLSAVGASPVGAQLPEAPLPELPVPEVPDVELPELPGDDGGGSSPVPSVETPSVGSGGGSTGSGSTGSGSGGGSSGGGGSGSGEGSGSDSCRCATPASGYPVAGDYDCPVENGAHGAASLDAAGLAASRSDGSSGGGANGAAGEVLGAAAYSGDAAQPPSADDGALLGELGEGGSAHSVLASVLFALIGLGLLVGIGGGLRAYRQGFP